MTEEGTEPFHNILDERVDGKLELRVRVSNCLRNAGIETIGDLLARTERDLMREPYFGRKSLLEVREELSRFGLRLLPLSPEEERLKTPQPSLVPKPRCPHCGRAVSVSLHFPPGNK